MRIKRIGHCYLAVEEAGITFIPVGSRAVHKFSKQEGETW